MSANVANFTIFRYHWVMVRQFSAGGFVYKKDEREIRWLIRRPKANEGYKGNLGWGWPKGWIDKGEDAKSAALREVKEETGVAAEIVEKIDTMKIFFRDNGELVMKNITYFLMKWKQDLPEGFGEETEETKWVTTKEAQELLAYDNEKKLLEKAEAMAV